MMTFSSDTEIAHIYAGLLDKTLPKAEWTHAAHFAAAVAMLCDKTRDAFDHMPVAIKAYNVATGVRNSDTEGYHHTITLASLRAAQSVIDAHRAENQRHVLTNRLLASKFGQPAWLLEYWSKDLLFSVQARHGWVPPDLMPLPFE